MALAERDPLDPSLPKRAEEIEDPRAKIDCLIGCAAALVDRDAEAVGGCAHACGGVLGGGPFRYEGLAGQTHWA